MKKLTPRMALYIIECLILEDGREDDLSDEIYRVAHCVNTKCTHKDWEQEILSKYIINKK